MIKTSIVAALAAMLLTTVTASVAIAAPGIVTRDSTVYKRDSSNSRELDEADRGEHVNIKDCGNRWCFVRRDEGPDGYIRKKDLAIFDGEVDDDDVDVNLGFGINSDGGFSLGFGIND